MPPHADPRVNIKQALSAVSTAPFPSASRDLLCTLGYASDRTVAIGSVDAFCRQFDSERRLDHPSALKAEWKSIHLLFQLTDQELARQNPLFKDTSVQQDLFQSYVFFAVELKGGDYARGKLTGLVRQINRIFPMPVMVLIKHLADKQPALSIAVINRRRHKLDPAKDVLEKAAIIRDISLANPHRGHLDILSSLALPNLVHPEKKPITDFDTLHAAWEQIFNVELLNERFYRELANWYFWALPQVDFPADLEPEDEKRRATGLIRLLTRLIFCWFLKEKNLIPETLFHPADLTRILKGFDPESETSSTYYQAILQNLFFATLNQRMGKDSNGKPHRKFVFDAGFFENKTNHDLNNYFRYESLFNLAPDDALALFEQIPFLNGGLFECLDKRDEEKKKTFYLDGFSRNAKKRAHVPDRLFFDSGETADLSTAYGDTKRKAEKVAGLITILNRYKFTIVENTPIDQEIALDPELLGKVFENLLASYNEETKTTARKQTGSFYTPRPIVDYMVDESLKTHLAHILVEKFPTKETNARSRLDHLFTYTEEPHDFAEPEIATLIDAIDALKLLDPACGSGAFPMGVLHKLVYILGKLDPGNVQWERIRIDKAQEIKDTEERRRKLAEITSNFADNDDDYGRKLYLIESCLYGVDIQPIAIQITKLRFFISLVCDQKTNRNKKENHGVRPLPNLETKFVAANSLIGLPEMTQSLLVDPRVGAIEKEIESLYHSHFSIQRRDQKLALQRKIKTLRQELAKLLSESLISPAKAKHIAEWDPFDPQSSADFFDPHWMFGRALIRKFDIIIGNPPYFKENDDKHRFDGLRDLPCYQGKMDVWYLFVDVGLGFLKTNGVLSFIATNNWVTNAGASKLRNRILKETRLARLIDFQDYMIFESASIQTMVMVITKEEPPHTYRAVISKAKSTFVREDIAKLQSGTNEENENLKTFAVDIVSKELLDKPLLFNSEDKSSILDIINANGEIRLLNTEIAQGIVPNPDRVNARNIKTLGERVAAQRGIKVGDGVFVLNRTERTVIAANEYKYLKPLYEPTHIEKYSKKTTDLNIIYAKRGYFDPQDAPSIVAHLRRFKEIMEARRENQTGQIHFYNLHWPRDESFFKSGEKLLVPRKCAEPIFYHTDDAAYVMLSMNVIRTSRVNMRFLSAVLNSSVVRYWLRYRGNMQGLNFQIDAAPLLRIPIPKEPEKVQRNIGSLVALIQLGRLHHHSSLNTAAAFLEDLVDACVMECYFREHMTERNLLFHDTVAQHLTAYEPVTVEAKRYDFLNHLHTTLNAPSHPIRNRLLRLTADSPDLLGVIKREGRM